MSLVRQSSLAAASAIILSGSRFVLTAIVARRLSQQGFGQFAYAQWLVDLGFLLCSLGATAAASRYIAQYRSDPARLACFLKMWRPWALGLPTVVGVIVLAGAMASGMALTPAAFAMLFVWGIANGLWAMQTAALAGAQRFDRILLANIIAAAIILGGVVALPIAAGGATLLFTLMAAAALAASLVGLSQTLRFIDADRAAIADDEARTIRFYALNMWFTALLWGLVWSRGEMPFVRHWMGDEGVARYAAIMTLLAGAMQGITLGISGAAAHLTTIWGEGRFDEAVHAARKVMDWQLLICGIAVLILATMAPEILGLVFGASYAGEAPLLAVMSLGLIAMTMSCQNHLLQIATDGRFSRNAAVIGLCVLMAGAILLIPRLGLIGAGTARMAAMTAMGLLTVGTVIRRWSVAGLSLGKMLALILLAVGACLIAQWGSLIERGAYLAGALLIVMLVNGRLLLIRAKRLAVA